MASRLPRLIIDNRIRVRLDRLTPELIKALKKKFTYKNPEFGYKTSLGIPTWNVPREIKTFREDDVWLTFPRGGMSKVREVFEDEGEEFRIRDRRTEGLPCPNFPKYIGPEMRYYQEAGIQAALKRENCVIRAPTGSGKSLMAISLAARIKLNTLVILPTVALLRQWMKDAESSLDTGGQGIGIIHQKKRILKPITATVQKTLVSQGIDESLRDYFGVIIVDECQKCAAASYIEAVDPWPARYRVGVSADERRRDKKEFLTTDLLGDKAYEVRRETLEEQGHVLDVGIYVVPTDFKADWYGVPEEIEEGEEEISEEDEKKIDFSRLLEEMTNAEARDKLGIEVAMREIKQGNQVIMLTQRREHCLKLDQYFVKKGVPSGFFIGGLDYAKQFEDTREGIASKQIKIGIGTVSALGVGVNLPSVAAGVAMIPIAGNRQNFNQVRGRLCRLASGKQEGRLYVLWDRHVYPGHLRNLVQWNPTVFILHKGKWVDARDYLGMRRRRKAKAS